MDFGEKSLDEHVAFIIKAHRDNSIKPSLTVRKWDEKTPYSIHPLWCATTILTETALSEELRRDGCLALLYHDITEDTKVALPDYLSDRVKQLVQGMVFPGGTPQERKEMWDRTDEIKLLKLYDKVSNLLDGIWINPREDASPREYLQNYVQRLTDEVEAKYGKLNIVRISRAINELPL